MAMTVGDVAKLARLSVRALHHYDEIGLLVPSGRSESGYRLYTDQDLERLQQVLFYRELGLSLEDIKALLEDPAFDRRAALVAQRATLAEKAERLRSMLALVDKTLAAMEGTITMNREDMFEVFGGFDPARHEAEAEQRWGNTDSFKESQRRTKSYTKDDWTKLKAEGDAITERFARAFEAGQTPSDEHAMEIAEDARLHIDRWFYPCSHERHAGLGEMYVQDPRFAENYERRRPGLARFIRDAIKANAERAAGA